MFSLYSFALGAILGCAACGIAGGYLLFHVIDFADRGIPIDVHAEPYGDVPASELIAR